MTKRQKILIGKLMAEDIPFKITKFYISSITAQNNSPYMWTISDIVFNINSNSWLLSELTDDQIIKRIKMLN